MAYADDVIVGPLGAEVSISDFGIPVKDHLNDLDGRDLARQSEINALRTDLGTWDGGAAAVTRIQDLETDVAALQVTGRYARYTQTSGSPQAIANGALVKLAFPTAMTSDPDITANAGRTEFTLNRAGIWIVEASVRWISNATGARHIWIAPAAASTQFRSINSGAPASGDNTVNETNTARQFTAGTVLSAWVLQTSGGSLNTHPGTVDEVECCRIGLTWLRP